MKKVVIVVLLFLIAKVSFAQNQSIYCLSVNQDGSTTITFEPCSPAGFTSAVIYANDLQTNVFHQVGQQSDITQTQYTDNTLNANIHSVRYKITKNVWNDSVSEDYASTMFLITQEIAPGVIKLTWNDARQGYSGSQAQQYHIYRRFALSDTQWKERGIANINGFIDSLPALCSDTAYYRIEIQNANGCTSVSNESKVYVKDVQIPLEPTALCISVDTQSQKIHFTWNSSPSSDTWGYVVCSGEPCLALDTLWGKQDTDYTCNGCNIRAVNSLAVMAFDSCFNTSLRSDNHKNIVLSANWKVCNEDIALSWTQYEGRGVDSYQLYVSKNGAAFQLFNTFTLSDQSCTYRVSSPIMDNDTYVFYVKAVLEGGVESYSNKLTCDFSAPPKVKYAFIRSATVSSDNKSVALTFFVDTSIVVSHYDLYRAPIGQSLQKVARLPQSGQPSFSYTDILPQGADKTAYTYQLQVPDECDLYYSTSNTLSTIRLQLSNDNDISSLNWNAPVGWEGINSYSLYRRQGSRDILLDNIYSGELTYTDDRTNADHSTDKISYYIVAYEQNPYVDSVQAHNSSCFATITSSTLFWIANAFTPLQITNKTFKPSLLYIQEGSYHFRVFNRWGKCIFSTTNLSEGWNGYYEGKILPCATYVYIVEYVDSTGEKQKQSGNVNLVY